MKSQSGDQDIAELLARSGNRQAPSDAARKRVHTQLLEVWEQLPEPTEEVGGLPRPAAHEPRRSLSQRWVIAAVVSIASIGALLAWQMQSAIPEAPIADIAYSTGGYAISPSGDGSTRLFVGSTVTTSGEGRLLLTLDAHTSVRIDRNTRATWRDNDAIYLHSGRLYVDSHGGNNSVHVITANGTVTKVGTQFEVQVQGQQLEVAVREGEVNVTRELDQARAKASAGVGEVLRYAEDGSATRSLVSTNDAEHWQWTQLSRPDFDMSQANYYAYLRWAARERGLTLLFEDQMLEQYAKSQLGAGRYDASDADIERVLQTERYYSRLPGAPHELRIGRR